jgi:hypothetical protein
VPARSQTFGWAELPAAVVAKCKLPAGQVRPYIRSRLPTGRHFTEGCSPDLIFAPIKAGPRFLPSDDQLRTCFWYPKVPELTRGTHRWMRLKPHRRHLLSQNTTHFIYRKYDTCLILESRSTYRLLSASRTRPTGPPRLLVENPQQTPQYYHQARPETAPEDKAAAVS